jgi:hypothetical protein
MEKVLKLMVVCLSLVIFSSCYKNYTKEDLVGVYVNNYHESMYKDIVLEMPRGLDTLIIYPNGRFRSSGYGDGTYKVTTGNPPYIHFAYYYISPLSNQRQKGGWGLPITPKSLFDRTPRFIISHDINYHYDRVESE